jgi:hypothetical protein
MRTMLLPRKSVMSMSSLPMSRGKDYPKWVDLVNKTTLHICTHHRTHPE